MQFTGGTSFQRSLNDLVKTNGVDARVRYDDDEALDASSTLELSSSASAQTPEGTVSSSQPGMLGYVEGFPTNLNVYGFGKDATEAGEKVREVTERVLRSIDGGNRGAYVIAHHINTPGVLMLQKHLEKFRDALRERNCELSIVTTVREPVVHRVSELLKFFPAPLEKDLKTVLKNEPAFPEAKGATPFKQLREFLFMDQFDVAKEQIMTTAGSENAGDGATEAIEANALFEAVTRAAERRGLAVDAFLEEGGFDDADLTEEERSVIGTSPAEASQKFDAALNAVVRVADDLIRTFDITLVRTEDQGEGLERLANKMDWHPELMQTEGTDAFETAQRNARDVMNAHTFTSDEDEVDVDLLPFSLRKSLHTWTELDLALYALAAAQAERFRTTRDSPENGAEPNCPPPNLLDAYALAKAARPDAARPDRKTGGTRAVLDAVRGASGCLPRAVSVLNAFFASAGPTEEAIPTPANDANDVASETATDAIPTPANDANDVASETATDAIPTPANDNDDVASETATDAIPTPANDNDDVATETATDAIPTPANDARAAENEVAALLREKEAQEKAADPGAVSDRAGMGFMKRSSGARVPRRAHEGTQEARVKSAIGFDPRRIAAGLGLETRTSEKHRDEFGGGAFVAGAQERRVEEALDFRPARVAR